jgi:DNA-binding transcriptional MerR regulator
MDDQQDIHGLDQPGADAANVERGDAQPISSRPVAQKEYYSISEVCDLVGLRPHVLRYWETQFPLLNPSKNRSGNRVYQRKEIKLILFVKTLLYEEKYTVEGAKQKLEQLRKGGELQVETKKALDRQMVALLRAEMQHLTELLTPTKMTPQR